MEQAVDREHAGLAGIKEIQSGFHSVWRLCKDPQTPAEDYIGSGDTLTFVQYRFGRRDVFGRN
jgi:hypothetical protein